MDRAALATLRDRSAPTYVIGDPGEDRVRVVEQGSDGSDARVVVRDGRVARDHGGDFGRDVALTGDTLVVIGATARWRSGAIERGGVWVFRTGSAELQFSGYASGEVLDELGLGVEGAARPWFVSVAATSSETRRVVLGVGTSVDHLQSSGALVEGEVTDDGIRLERAWSARALGLSGARNVGEHVHLRTVASDDRHHALVTFFGQEHPHRHRVAALTLSDDAAEVVGFLEVPEDVLRIGGMCEVPDLSGDGVDDIVLGASTWTPSSLIEELGNYGQPPVAFEALFLIYDGAAGDGVPRLVGTVSGNSFVDEAGEPVPVHWEPDVALDPDGRHLVFSGGDRGTVNSGTSAGLRSTSSAVWRVPLDDLVIDRTP